MKWSLVSAVNNDEALKSCLLSSPDAASVAEIILQRGFSSAASAYNAAIQKARCDLLVFAHQDVYLPGGWFSSVEKAVELLSAKDPNWGILGVWGVSSTGSRAGFLYCTGLGATLEGNRADVSEVLTLDEVVLILRRSSGLSFDEKLPGFHMYGADICLAARSKGMKCYAIRAFCIHNTNGYRMLPLAFWRAYLFMRKKWKSELPVPTSCILISFWCWPMLRWNIVRGINLLIGRDAPPAGPAPDPGRLHGVLVSPK
jgi:hypothetical protein